VTMQRNLRQWLNTYFEISPKQDYKATVQEHTRQFERLERLEKEEKIMKSFEKEFQPFLQDFWNQREQLSKLKTRMEEQQNLFDLFGGKNLFLKLPCLDIGELTIDQLNEKDGVIKELKMTASIMRAETADKVHVALIYCEFNEISFISNPFNKTKEKQLIEKNVTSILEILEESHQTEQKSSASEESDQIEEESSASEESHRIKDESSSSEESHRIEEESFYSEESHLPKGRSVARERSESFSLSTYEYDLAETAYQYIDEDMHVTTPEDEQLIFSTQENKTTVKTVMVIKSDDLSSHLKLIITKGSVTHWEYENREITRMISARLINPSA